MDDFEPYRRRIVEPVTELLPDGRIQIAFPPLSTIFLATPQEAVDLAFGLLTRAKAAGLDLGDDSDPPWTKERMLLLTEKLEAIIYANLAGAGRLQPAEPLKNVHPIRHQNPDCLLLHMQHCLWMLGEMRTFVEANRIRKFNRWLGDVGGVLRTLGVVTLDDLRTLFAPEGAAINHDRK